MKGLVPAEFRALGPALSGRSAHPSPPRWSRGPRQRDADVDEADVEGQSCGPCVITDAAVQQAATWTDRKGHREETKQENRRKNKENVITLKKQNKMSLVLTFLNLLLQVDFVSLWAPVAYSHAFYFCYLFYSTQEV